MRMLTVAVQAFDRQYALVGDEPDAAIYQRLQHYAHANGLDLTQTFVSQEGEHPDDFLLFEEIPPQE